MIASMLCKIEYYKYLQNSEEKWRMPEKNSNADHQPWWPAYCNTKQLDSPIEMEVYKERVQHTMVKIYWHVIYSH